MTIKTLEVTPEVVKADGTNRVAKTGSQAGAAGSLVIVGLWLAHQIGWHGEMPEAVVVALTGLLTTAGSVLMNLSKLKGRV